MNRLLSALSCILLSFVVVHCRVRTISLLSRIASISWRCTAQPYIPCLLPSYTLVAHTTYFSSLYHSGLAVYQIDDTVALLGDVLFRDHLDCLLCDHTPHEGSSVWNVGSRGTCSGILSVGPSLRENGGLQFSDGILEGGFH